MFIEKKVRQSIYVVGNECTCVVELCRIGKVSIDIGEVTCNKSNSYLEIEEVISRQNNLHVVPRSEQNKTYTKVIKHN